MLDYRPFKTEHLWALVPQELQRREHALLLTAEYGDILGRSPGMSVWDGNACIAALGYVPMYQHRAMAWAFFSPAASRHMPALARRVRKALSGLPFKRIEATVSAAFPHGCRFAELVGMRLETPVALKAYGAFGEDEFIYAMVKS